MTQLSQKNRQRRSAYHHLPLIQAGPPGKRSSSILECILETGSPFGLSFNILTRAALTGFCSLVCIINIYNVAQDGVFVKGFFKLFSRQGRLPQVAHEYYYNNQGSN